MFSKIKAFLSRVVHATGRLLGLKVDLGPFQLSLWVGREDPDTVSFAVDITYSYYPGYLRLDANVAVGVIMVELSLMKSSPE
jgi:hypothetical protein